MKRIKLSKRVSKNMYRKGYSNIKAINIASKPMRGGFSI